MGLDMYLRAERRFDPASDDGVAILRALGRSFNEIEPMGEYLGMWDHSPADEVAYSRSVMEAAGLLPMLTDGSPSGSVDREGDVLVVGITCAYWRKANAIHNWFVTKCQDGVDECQSAPVEAEQLAHLRSQCVDALSAYDSGDPTKAAEILPPTSGFFFGGTDVDEGYAYDLRQTVEAIERVIRLAVEIRAIQFVYQSSW